MTENGVVRQPPLVWKANLTRKFAAGGHDALKDGGFDEEKTT
jgi:hypothetical protein